MDKRTILAVGLIILVIGAYNLFIIPKFAPPPPPPVEQAAPPADGRDGIGTVSRSTDHGGSRLPARPDLGAGRSLWRPRHPRRL